MIATDINDTLTTGQAARELGLSAIWVRRLITTGQLTATRTPLGFLVDRAAVEALRLKRQAVTA
jgi:excisionase family DNA binding protein